VFAKNLDPRKYKIIVISHRTYFVFTPLLTDTAVGTLEFRNVLESIWRANSGVEYIQVWADDVNFVAKTIDVEPAVLDPAQSYALTSARGRPPENKITLEEEKYLVDGGTVKDNVPVFPVKYDKLVVSIGSYSQTFNTPGVGKMPTFSRMMATQERLEKGA
jgi:NADH dehydrogenase FAD-containing subunit